MDIPEKKKQDLKFFKNSLNGVNNRLEMMKESREL